MKAKIITIDNMFMTKKRAIEEAREYNDQTGLDVIVCNMIGDVVFLIRNGKNTDIKKISKKLLTSIEQYGII